MVVSPHSKHFNFLTSEVRSLKRDLIESVLVVVELVARPLPNDKAVVGAVERLAHSQFVAEVRTVQPVAEQGAVLQAVDDPTRVCGLIYCFKIE